MLSSLFTYKVAEIRVIDGDTIEADIDLGFGVWARKQRFRLNGINAPEVTGSEKAEGLKSKTALERLLKGRPCIIQSKKAETDKYGRYLVDVYYSENLLNPTDDTMRSVNRWLVDSKLAKEAIF